MGEEEGKPPKAGGRKLLRFTQGAVMLAAAFFLTVHVLKWERVRIDGVSLALLAFLLVVPLAELVRKVKLGEFEAEIGRDEVAKAQAKAAVELPPSSPAPASSLEEEVFQQLLRDDPRLALAKVRIELEEALRRLYAQTTDPEPDWRRLSLGRMVDGLAKREAISPQIAGALRDVIGLANRAVHGEHVEPSTAQELVTLGLRLVAELQHLYVDRVLRPSESVVISSTEVESFSSARYRVTTVVPLVENPKRNTYVLSQEELDAFLEGYREYAEFIVGVERA